MSSRGRELSNDAAFGRRVRRLALVSAPALGALCLIWWTTDTGSPALGAVLAAGWAAMPLLLAASLRRPRLRYALVVPVALVGTPVGAAALGLVDVSATARVGWILVEIGILLGAVLGLWLWYRILPVPASLDDPFSPGRTALIAVHVLAVVAGLAVLVAASVT